MRLLVTGSSGFVGGWLLAHLAELGDEVVALDERTDITDRAAIRDAVVAAAPDAVVHLAAQASVGSSWGDEGRTFSVNAGGTLNLLDAAAACTPMPRVLLISSAEVYGRVTPDQLPLPESAPMRPVSPYAVSKAAAELLGLQAWLGRGLEVVRARPFNHTGPGQRPDFVVPSLARQVAEAARSGAGALHVGNLSARRDLTDVRDVVRAYRLLVEHGAPGEAYNVCRGSAVGIDDVARRLLELAAVDVPVVVDPERVRPVDIPELRGDPAAIEAATGWRPEIPWDATLGDLLAAWGQPTGPARGATNGTRPA
ncbi:MAG TPA: GDP-mannose 4,6-dehydratase [Acidimicrobiales bacterium]|nr:GDP-mannose 4,6-dehydratase [Acidimicrobiales bacterium]